MSHLKRAKDLLQNLSRTRRWRRSIARCGFGFDRQGCGCRQATNHRRFRHTTFAIVVAALRLRGAGARDSFIPLSE